MRCYERELLLVCLWNSRDKLNRQLFFKIQINSTKFGTFVYAFNFFGWLNLKFQQFTSIYWKIKAFAREILMLSRNILQLFDETLIKTTKHTILWSIKHTKLWFWHWQQPKMIRFKCQLLSKPDARTLTNSKHDQTYIFFFSFNFSCWFFFTFPNSFKIWMKMSLKFNKISQQAVVAWYWAVQSSAEKSR